MQLAPCGFTVKNIDLIEFVSCLVFFFNLLLFCCACATNRVTELLDYTPEELTGKNIYNLCHGEDSEKLRRSHLDRKSCTQTKVHFNTN